jgi:hypothetical protein
MSDHLDLSADRVKRGRSVVDALADLYGMTIDHEDPEAGDGIATMLGDILCDLMHSYGVAVVEMAVDAGWWHYANETGEVRA